LALLTLWVLGCTDKPSMHDTAPSTHDSNGPVDSGVDTGPFDRDGDGWVASEDCDDSDASVHPGATETWYDGVDQDCAGDDDDDADADGHAAEAQGGDDCDDTDQTIYEGALETACDGIDQDCDGSDTDDADGDGETPAACGGLDCDDADPWTNTSAEEWCDETDHDCDGEPLADGICGGPQEVLPLSRLTVLPDSGEGDYAFARIDGIGDLNADGSDDLYVYCLDCEKADGSYGSIAYLLDGPTWGSEVLHTEIDATTFTQGRFGSGIGEYTVPLGDFDGDGIDDLLLAGPSYSYYEGGALIVLGPSQEWGEEADIEDLADFAWLSFEGSDGVGTTPAAGDFDGDGLMDAVVGGGGDKSNHGDDDHMWVFFGREQGDEPEWDYGFEDEVRVMAPERSGDTLLGFEIAAGDLDGDGADDVIVHEVIDDVTYVVSGQDLESAHNQRIDDIAVATFDGDLDCLSVLGDWSGDGYGDWVAGVWWTEVEYPEAGALYFHSGGEGGGASTYNDAVGFLYGGPSDGTALGRDCSAADIDGDSRDELVIAATSTYDANEDSYGVLDDAAGLPEGSTRYAPPLEFSLRETDLLDRVTEAPLLDWDGDGDSDLLLLGYAESAGPGGFAIIPGWDIPWDEPEYW